MFKRAIPQATTEQQLRQDRARSIGCICCIIEQCREAGWPEIHHQTISGRQISQWHTVCLCSWHHRGICLAGFNTSHMTKSFGPSLAKGSKTFAVWYGSNEEQLAYQNKLILAKHGVDYEVVTQEMAVGSGQRG